MNNFLFQIYTYYHLIRVSYEDQLMLKKLLQVRSLWLHHRDEIDWAVARFRLYNRGDKGLGGFYE